MDRLELDMCIRRWFIAIPAAFFGILLTASSLYAADYYISPTGSEANPGTITQPFKTIKGNAWRLKAGDTMILRGGTYEGDRISLNNDGSQTGTASSPITFKAFPGEKPILSNSYTPATGAGAAISLGNNNNYLVFDGVNIHNMYGHFMYMDRSHHITIKNCEFKNSDGVWMGVYLNYVSYLTLQNCVLDEVSDNTQNENVNMIHVEGSHHNLFENLTITKASHSLIDFQNSYSNVIRNNVLHNEWQKNTGMAAPYTNKHGRNIYDNNIIYGARPAFTKPGKGAMGMYINQSSNIIRRNVIYDNQNFGIILNSDNAFANSNIYFNKIYNNTLYNNGYLQGYDQSANYTITDFWNGWDLESNIFKNNIAMDGKSQNIMIQSLNNSGFDNNIIAGNCLYNPSSPSAMIEVIGVGQNSLTWFQSVHPQYVFGNTEVNPNFVSLTTPNFSLNSNSGCIDKGVALTNTRSAGSGAVVPVYDVGYFTDGMGIISGDIIRVGNEEVRITGIDYTNNNLSVDRTISWTNNMAVNLPYAGNAPDPGASEVGVTATPIPTPIPTAAPIDNEGFSKLIPMTVTASSSDGTNIATNTTDGNLSTRWSACGIGEWIMYDFGSVKNIAHSNIAFYLATTQTAVFNIEVSSDGVSWTPILTSQQSNTNTLDLQKFNFVNTSARYIRIVGQGNLTTTDSCWNSYTEVEHYGSAASPSPTPSPTASPTASPIAVPNPTPVAGVSSWFSTFDSTSSITSPLIGSAGRLSGATITTGRIGNGIACTAGGQHVAIPTANNFNKASGTIEFWIKPNWSHTDGIIHHMFIDSIGALGFIKNANNELHFYTSQGTTFPEVKVSPANYTMSANTWYKIKLQWNEQAAKSDQLKIFINGVEPVHTDGVDDLNSSLYNLGSDMVVCASASTINTNATIDEFKASKIVTSWKTGDADEDGIVDGKDYVKWLNNYSTTVSTRYFGGDYNEDGVVDGRDYVIWLNNYNQ